MRSRISVRDMFIAVAVAILTLPTSFIMSEFITGPQLGATIAVLLAIVAGFLLITFADWAVWREDKQERIRLNKALRAFELWSGEVMGQASEKRSARWWWRPLGNWWLKRRDKEPQS